jgi:diguanylate cyclase (GGDEF)-like protein/putative nucleotidyltransferase with HDIG domain
VTESVKPLSHGYPPRLLRYALIVIATGIPVAVGAFATIAAAPPDANTAVAVVAFALAALVAELKPVPLDDTGARSVSLSIVFLISTQVLFGWEYAALAALFAMGIDQIVNRAKLLRGAFNTAVLVLAAYASSLPAVLLGWDQTTMTINSAGELIVLVFAGGAMFVTVNVVLIAGAVSLYQGVPLRVMLEDYIRHSGPAFGIMGFIAALATALWLVAPLFELLLAGPVLALSLYQRYAFRAVVATRDAETDGLTGMRNHRSFHTDLREQLSFSSQTRGELSLAMIDIDNFKSINDRFGHPIGDQVLLQLATLMRAEFGGGHAYRIGGEEFAVLMLGDGEQDAYAAMERLHARLWQTSFPTGEPVSVSIGIATYPTTAGDLDELLKVADGALYWAKNHGKNRSCVYSPNVVRIFTPEEIAESAERHARLRAAESLIRVVDAKDTYAGAHSQSVSRLVEGIARAMELDDETVEQVRLAGLLHDLGKIAIPDRILQKPGKLDPNELRTMREHAELGYRLLEGLGVSPVDRWIRHHHEWWDGSGYPLGLAGEDIPLGSRVILVADAFDAMTSDRVYRAAGSVPEALSELRRRCWTQFDARVVAALERHLERAGQLGEGEDEAEPGRLTA